MPRFAFAPEVFYESEIPSHSSILRRRPEKSGE
jgi:hypothetical protein